MYSKDKRYLQFIKMMIFADFEHYTVSLYV